jgi:hypothetical protein
MNTPRRPLLPAGTLLLAWALTSGPAHGASPDENKPWARGPAAVAADVDRIVQARLDAEKVPASPAADDAEFLRRASLDIDGRIPRAERVAAFLADTDPNKRARLIDELLADRAYGEHFAIVWYHRIVRPDDDNRFGLKGNRFREWLADEFNAGHGWDRTVADILTASGDRDRHPATTFWLANVGSAKTGQPEPSKVTAAATRLFLGVRLECCECHNHPFGALKQTDFWSTAAFFTQTHADNAGKKTAKEGGTPSVREGGRVGRQRRAKAEEAPFGSIAIPYGSGKTVSAAFLDGTRPDLAGRTALRPAFAAWLTSSRNPYFARAAVNKMWANFFGRGVVEPVDDMRPENVARATHSELLDVLAAEFTASGFDQRHLVRCICNSRTYRRTSSPLPGNKDDDALYGRMPLKVMTADMLYDSLAVALSHAAAEPEGRGDKAARKKRKHEGGVREQFRKFFHAEADDDVGVVEDYAYGILQVLRLMNSKPIADTSETVATCMKAGATPERVIESLYLTVLSRKPSATEVERVKAHVARAGTPEGYADAAWALLNSSEFLFNH